MPAVDLPRRTVVVSSGPSAARAAGTRSTLAAPAIDRLVRKLRRVCTVGITTLPPPRSRLQLAFELVEEAPISALGDDLLRARFDEPRFAHTQSIKPHCILGVVFAPFVIGKLAQGLGGIIGAGRATRTGSGAQRSVALRMARTARLVATGWLCTNSRLPASMQQKYCDHGRSKVLSTITWPTCRARRSCGWGGKLRTASIFRSMN